MDAMTTTRATTMPMVMPMASFLAVFLGYFLHWPYLSPHSGWLLSRSQHQNTITSGGFKQTTGLS